MKKLLITCFFLIFACKSSTEFANGVEFKKNNGFNWTTGNGFRGEESGYPFSIVNSSIFSNEFAMAKVEYNRINYLVLIKKLKENPDYYILRIEDFKELQDLSENYDYFFPWDTKCGIKKSANWQENGSEVFVVKFQQESIYPEIVKIWTVDINLQKIVEVNTNFGHCNYIDP